ncbi:MAG TPA: BatD family protein [Polyangia bacterium]|jgi:hypothetical protein
MAAKHVRFLVAVALAPALLAPARPAAAQARVSVIAELSSGQVALDEEVQLTFHVSLSGSAKVERFHAPSLRDFEVRDTATQRRVEFSLGGFGGAPQHVRIEDRIYLLRPRKAGTITIGEAEVVVNGRSHRSRALQLRVAPGAGGPAAAAPPGAPTASPAPAAPPPPVAPGEDEDLFLRASVDKARVYVGEQVTASWQAFTQSAIEKYRPVREPKIDAFWTEDLFMPTVRLGYERAQHRGQQYLVALLLKKALFPLQAGKQVVGPLEAEFITQASLFVAPTGSTRRSQPVTIEVLPLPAGAPAGFDAANVGQYTVTASIDRNQVAAGEAVTLKLVVRGTGNLRQLKVPPLTKLEGFRVYEPKIADQIEPGPQVGGTKTVEYLIVPQKVGELVIPPIGLPCFDPQTKRYVTPRTEPLRLNVIGETPPSALPQATAGKAENVLLPDIALIRNRHAVGTRVDRVVVRPGLLAGVLAAPPVLLLGLLAGERLRDLIRRETARSRLRKARSGARRRLRAAEALARSGAERIGPAFFGELAKALYEHLEVVLGAPVTGRTLAELGRYLEQRGVPAATAAGVVAELESCDFARFAPAAAEPEELRAAVKRVRALLDALEAAPVTEAAP